MRRACGTCVIVALIAATGCDRESASSRGPATPAQPVSKSVALVRAERRAFDGAPPTIPHQNFSMRCTQCHNQRGLEVPGVGFAPPAPHGNVDWPGAFARCNQCHVFIEEKTAVFVASDFDPLRQDLRHGKRLNDLSPPIIPHMVFMRENCLACHTGPAAREEIRTTHPERANCKQCHVEKSVDATFPF